MDPAQQKEAMAKEKFSNKPGGTHTFAAFPDHLKKCQTEEVKVWMRCVDLLGWAPLHPVLRLM